MIYGVSVISARGFVVLWAALTAVVVGYALVDLRLSPSLWTERHFSMRPDLDQIWEVRHWGGRLVREGAWEILLPNALVLGGLGALFAHAAIRRLSRRSEADLPRETVVPTSIPSVPPPA